MNYSWYFDDNGTLIPTGLPRTVVISGLVYQSKTLVDNGDWANLALAGYYREHREDAYPYMSGWEDPVISNDAKYDPPVVLVAAGPKMTVDEIRDQKKIDIDGQVEDSDVRTIARDPAVETDLQRQWAAASERALDLENTPDNDVEAFDPTIQVGKPLEEGAEYSDFSIQNVELDPWVGQPSNDIGFLAQIRIITSDHSVGSSARLQVIAAPSDVGAILPFVQDANDTSIWTCEARDGHKWSDQNATVSVKLLWGAGSLPVSPTVTTVGMYNRKAAPVRYGVAA